MGTIRDDYREGQGGDGRRIAPAPTSPRRMVKQGVGCRVASCCSSNGIESRAHGGHFVFILIPCTVKDGQGRAEEGDGTQGIF